MNDEDILEARWAVLFFLQFHVVLLGHSTCGIPSGSHLPMKLLMFTPDSGIHPPHLGYSLQPSVLGDFLFKNHAHVCICLNGPDWSSSHRRYPFLLQITSSIACPFPDHLLDRGNGHDGHRSRASDVIRTTDQILLLIDTTKWIFVRFQLFIAA